MTHRYQFRCAFDSPIIARGNFRPFRTPQKSALGLALAGLCSSAVRLRFGRPGRRWAMSPRLRTPRQASSMVNVQDANTMDAATARTRPTGPTFTTRTSVRQCLSHSLAQPSFYGEAFLMMELPERHATSLYGQPAQLATVTTSGTVTCSLTLKLKFQVASTPVTGSLRLPSG